MFGLFLGGLKVVALLTSVTRNGRTIRARAFYDGSRSRQACG